MAEFQIMSKDGLSVRAFGALVYNGTYLKPGYVEFQEIASPTPIPWEAGDYVDYPRTGLRYKLYITPKSLKQGEQNLYGGSFVYENVQFFDSSKEIELAPFIDLVPYDNLVHFSTLNSVAFVGTPANVAERVQACLEYWYPSSRWRVKVVSSLDPTEDVELIETLATEAEFSISGATCLDVLDKVYETWNGLGWSFSVEGDVNTITIGAPNKRTASNTTDLYSRIGDNGLTAIARSVSNVEEMGTRLYAYGSSRNIPTDYYRSKNIKDAESVDIEHLMIPINPVASLDYDGWGLTDGVPDARLAYIEDEAAVSKYGLIPRYAYFDGSDPSLPEIFPSIEGVTIGDVIDAKAQISDTSYVPSLSRWSRADRIDEVVSAVNPSDNGGSSSNGEKYAESGDYATTGGELDSSEGENPDTLEIGHFSPSSAADIVDVAVNLTGTIRLTDTTDISGVRMVVRVLAGSATATAAQEILISPQNTDPSGVYSFSLEGATTRINLTGMSYVQILVEGYKGEGGDYAAYDYHADINAGSVFLGFNSSLGNTFTATIPQIGFNLLQYADMGNGKTISMKSGMCAGRDFPIKAATYNRGTDTWQLTVGRVKDTDTGLWFPNSDFPIESGDKYVLLDIAMPELYILMGAVRLLKAAKRLLGGISSESPFYEPQIDSKRVYNENRILREGMWMHLGADEIVDGGGDYALIDTLRIDEAVSNIPVYEVTLRKKKSIEWTETISRTSTSVSSTPVEETHQTVAPTTKTLDWFIVEEVTENEVTTYRLKLNPKYEGMYAEGWVSASGASDQGGGGGGTGYLRDLLDVNASMSPTQGQALVWDDALGKWTAGDVSVDLTPFERIANRVTTVSSSSNHTQYPTAKAVYDIVNTMLSSAMRFQGVTSTALVDGSTTNPVVVDGASYTATRGDVVVRSDVGLEYLWTGARWQQLGDETSYAKKTVTITGSGYLTGGGNLEAARTIDIAAEVKTKIDNGATAFGYFTDGAANEAIKLRTPRTIWGQPFDGSADVSGYMSGMTGIIAGLSTPTLGVMDGTVALGIKSLTERYGLFEWVEGNGNVGLQVGRSDGDDSAYNLMLNPLGGKVGIGTKAPGALFQVHGFSGEVARLSQASNYTAGAGPKLTFYNSGSEEIASVSGVFDRANSGQYGNLLFGTRASDTAGVTIKMVIMHNGNVGIGTYGPSYKLDVVGDARAAGKVYIGTTGGYLEVVNVGTAASPVYALKSSLPFYSDSWVSAGGVSPTGSGGGITGYLKDLLDVNGSMIPVDGQALVWDSSLGDNGRWTSKNISVDLTPFERTTNKVTSILESSTDGQYPSARAVYNALSSKADSSALSGYLPLAGGTMTGTIKYGGAGYEIIRTGGDDTNWRGGLRYSWSSNTTIALWGRNANSQFVWHAGTDFSSNDVDGTITRSYDFQVGRYNGTLEALIGGYKIWHQGNDGSGSGLDADLLDGKHADSFAAIASPNNLIHSGNEFTFIPPNYNNTVWFNYRTSGYPISGNVTGYYFGNGHGDALASITDGQFSGNAASATKLQTARSIWGQNFDGIADVSGAMTGVTSIDALLNFDAANGRLGVGTPAPIAPLDIRRHDTGETPLSLTYSQSRDDNIFAAKIALVDDGTYFGNLVFRVKTTASSGESASYYTDALTIKGQNGNVGIGMNAPAYKLDVNGIIRGEKLIGTATGITETSFEDEEFTYQATPVKNIADGYRVDRIKGNTIVSDGELINNSAEAIETTGFNQWDEECINGFYSAETGNYNVGDGICSKNMIPVIPNTQYHIKSGVYSIRQRFFSKDGSYIGYEGQIISEGILTTPPGAYYMHICILDKSTYNHDICINLSDPDRNGEYEPYRANRLAVGLGSIKVKDSNGDILEFNGLKSAGSVYDEIVGNKYIKRIGEVDLGSLSWYETSGGIYGGTFYASVNNRKTGINILCGHYTTVSLSANLPDKCITEYAANDIAVRVKDTAYTDAASFKAALAGVMLYYELATPVTYDLVSPVPLSGRIDGNGTMRVISDGPVAPFRGDITYGCNPGQMGADASSVKSYLDTMLEIKVVDGQPVLHSKLPLYSDSWISAGGLSDTGEEGGATYLKNLLDVDDNLVESAGYGLVYDGTQWTSEQIVPASRKINGVTLTSDVSLSLGSLSNVSVTGATNGQQLIYNGSEWIAGTPAGAKFFHGTCSTSSSSNTKVVDCPSFTSTDLVAGTAIAIVMYNRCDTTSTVAINVNGTGANTLLAGFANRKAWSAGELILAVYDGSGDWDMLPTWYYTYYYGGGGSGGGGGTGSTVVVHPSQISEPKIEIATISVDGTGYKLFAPSVSVSQTQGSTGGTQIASINSTAIYAPAVTVTQVQTSGVEVARIKVGSANPVSIFAPSGSSGSSGVQTVVGRTGDVTTDQIATALTNAGYKLTDTVQDLSGYLPLTAGSSKALTNTLYTRGLLPTANASFDLGSLSAAYNNTYTKRVYLADGVYIEYDSTNRCVYVHGAGIATDSFVSAGGVSTTSN